MICLSKVEIILIDLRFDFITYFYMSRSQLRKDKTCLDCNYVVENRFCPNCGRELEVKANGEQNADQPVPS
jgi:rRNA maturation endonuclease Nob1